MFLAFGESLAILGLLFAMALGGAMLLALAWRAVAARKISRLGCILAALAAMPFVSFGTMSAVSASREYNPPGVTIDQIAGTYRKGNRVLTLNRDGTYRAENLKDFGTGTWSHFDWNLSFSERNRIGGPDHEPRWILQNGKPGILPYYTGADGSDGILLLKQQ